jgi:SAM-dependent methyltransferase
MNLKNRYAINHSKRNKLTLYFNKRLFNTYNKIALKLLKRNLHGSNIDLGSGDLGFTEYLKTINIKSFPYDYPSFDIEIDNLHQKDESVDFITMNAVIEHIKCPDNIFREIWRVLKKDGLLFVNTPNWKMDYKNFYNDPTHVKPFTPISLKQTFEFYNLKTIFIEPALIEKSWFWWQLPDKIKWFIASLIKGGSKSIIGVAIKK